MNYLIVIVATISIYLTSSLPEGCGDIKITCEEPDIDKCCEGACCPLLARYQNIPNKDRGYTLSRMITMSKTFRCPQIGELCSSEFLTDFSSMCCDGSTMLIRGSTECKFTGFDSKGFQIGTCCVKHRNMGCTKDADCCESNDFCNNGYCAPQTNPIRLQINENALPQSLPVAAAAETKSKEVPMINNDDIMDRIESKANYEHYLSIIAVAVMFMGGLIVIFCLMDYLFRRRFVKRRNMVNNMECDLSDHTDFEDSSTVYDSSL